MHPTSRSPRPMPLRLPDGLTLYFCRHGQTEANVEGRFQGHSRDTALTALGREQAAIVGRLLAAREPAPAHLKFVSSPLPRARKTIEIIRTTLGLDPYGYTLDPRIVEINLGAWDGLTHAEARVIDPDAYERRESDKWDVRVPGGGECYADVATRCENWIAGLTADTFAVSHGAFTRILRGLIEGLTWKEMSDLDEKQGVLFRAGGARLERIEEKA